MKQRALLRHPCVYGGILKREGWSHALWTNPRTGETEAVPRHAEIPDVLTRKVCRGLSVPEAGR